jgi:hypothetical protein
LTQFAVGFGEADVFERGTIALHSGALPLSHFFSIKYEDSIIIENIPVRLTSLSIFIGLTAEGSLVNLALRGPAYTQN